MVKGGFIEHARPGKRKSAKKQKELKKPEGRVFYQEDYNGNTVKIWSAHRVESNEKGD